MARPKHKIGNRIENAEGQGGKVDEIRTRLNDAGEESHHYVVGDNNEIAEDEITAVFVAKRPSKPRAKKPAGEAAPRAKKPKAA